MYKIKEILKNIRPEEDFEKSEDFVEDGLLDSFDVVTLVSELDKNFNISIDGADIMPDNFNKFINITRLLKKYEVDL